MADTINDGGPAFARPLGALNGEEWSIGQEGMSLRDYFAGQALQGMFAGGSVSLPFAEGHEKGMETAAMRAYRAADAMLAAREAKS